MSRTRADLRADERLDLGERLLSVDEKAEILLGGQSGHHPQAVPPRRVEQGARRHRVRYADRVEAVRPHEGEVPLDRAGVLVLATVRVRAECAVDDSADVHLLVAGEDELASRFRPTEPKRAGRSNRLRENRSDRSGPRAPSADRHTGRYAEMRGSCAGITRANHSIVRRSPSRSGTVGVHPSTASALPISGRRRAGSSSGNGK